MYSLQVLRTTEHVKELIEFGADPNETDVYDKSILGGFPKMSFILDGWTQSCKSIQKPLVVSGFFSGKPLINQLINH